MNITLVAQALRDLARALEAPPIADVPVQPEEPEQPVQEQPVQEQPVQQAAEQQPVQQAAEQQPVQQAAEELPPLTLEEFGAEMRAVAMLPHVGSQKMLDMLPEIYEKFADPNNQSYPGIYEHQRRAALQHAVAKAAELKGAA